MLALECDRCGKLYKPYENLPNVTTYNAFQFVSKTPNYVDKASTPFDLCPECMKGLLWFIKIGKEEEKEE